MPHLCQVRPQVASNGFKPVFAFRHCGKSFRNYQDLFTSRTQAFPLGMWPSDNRPGLPGGAVPFEAARCCWPESRSSRPGFGEASFDDDHMRSGPAGTSVTIRTETYFCVLAAKTSSQLKSFGVVNETSSCWSNGTPDQTTTPPKQIRPESRSDYSPGKVNRTFEEEEVRPA